MAVAKRVFADDFVQTPELDGSDPMRTPAVLLILAALGGAGTSLVAQEGTGGLEARVWLDRGGEEPLLRRGESVRIYYRVSEDAFAAIFRIDTDGRVVLLYPQHPGAIEVVGGGRDYRLLSPEGTGWRVEEDPGMGYLFMIASAEPLDFSRFPFDERYGWDLGAVGAAVYSDPYVAIDDYVAAIVPGWETLPYGLDFLTYSVGETYSYPRFLCYDCHTYQRFSSWNPYDYTCVTYRVVIWDDPYFYPSYRYSGVNVVYAWPARALPRYEVTRRAVGDAVAPVVRVRTPAQREAAYKESPTVATRRTEGVVRRSVAASPTAGTTAAAGPRAAQPVRRSSAAALASPQERSGAGPRQVPDTTRSRPTLQRRPSARLPVRTPPAARPAQPEPAEPKSATPAPSRTSPRAPITRPQRMPQSAPATVPPTGRQPQAAPSRPSTSAPPRPSAQPSAGARPQTTPRASPPSAGSGSGRPATTRPTPTRPTASPAPSRPRETPTARPSPSARPAEPRAAPPRSAEPRPTVRSRPAEPPSRN